MSILLLCLRLQDRLKCPLLNPGMIERDGVGRLGHSQKLVCVVLSRRELWSGVRGFRLAVEDLLGLFYSPQMG